MQTLTLPTDRLNQLEKNLEEVLKEIRGLKQEKKKVAKKFVHFWTEAQWEKAEREAGEDIKAGRVSGPFNSAQELIEHLHKEAGV